MFLLSWATGMYPFPVCICDEMDDQDDKRGQQDIRSSETPKTHLGKDEIFEAKNEYKDK